MAKRSEIAKMILTGIAVAGFIVVAATLPGAVLALAPFVDSDGKYSPAQVKRSINSLQKQRLISMKYEGNKILITLTKNGKKKFLKYKLDEMKIKPQDKWDKKWRIVIFDIPERLNTARKMFRDKLKEMGFEQFQRSVWVCPYPCEDEIDFLKEIYMVRFYVRIITAENVDIQDDLIKRFNLTNDLRIPIGNYR